MAREKVPEMFCRLPTVTLPVFVSYAVITPWKRDCVRTVLYVAAIRMRPALPFPPE